MESLLTALPPELAVITLAAVPVIELRGAVPLGLALGLNPAWVYVLAVVGNLLPIPFVYHLLLPVRRWLSRSPKIRVFIDRYFNRLQRRSSQVARYGFWGLVLFVGVPLPGTGAWTGAIVAVLLGMRLRPSMIALAAGTMLAGVIVLVLWFLGGAIVGQGLPVA